MAEATSPGSRADYTCYTIRGAAGVLAVVIETMEQSSQDALAQVYPHSTDSYRIPSISSGIHALAQVYPHSLPEHITDIPTYTAGNGVRRCI